MELKGKKINFLGDSITEGVGTSDGRFRYVDRVAALTGAECRNYGVSGTRIALQRTPTVDAPRFDEDFYTRGSAMLPDADIVVVFGGTNDFGHGDAPFGVIGDKGRDTFCGAVASLCEMLIGRYPEADIVFITPLHRLNEDVPTGDNKPAPVATLREYIAAMREILAFYSIPVLDLWNEGKIQPRVPILQEKYAPDGLHPNDAGNELIARRLIGFLRQL